ncbi:hypothetical protein FM037_08155 [Shewanella psychropiezotolerans]|uniref:Big-1 domain-containing protein n=1 Tax=Shewanella psychropiezotolerans TaxID=2593655 RepID=A0ABX5WVS2_9GAMM|nr:DUF823 domain-containing adhesin [Shewanella psychropiezotolerans]QDO83205.1 hypothetical protein FM037_08155 [Shewanella psychropiezotolerans]
MANKNTAIANDVDTVELTASFVRDTGPVVGAVLSYSLSSSPEKTVITTDEQGEAKFSVKSTQAGTAAVNLEYVNNTSETVRVSTDINFIGDIDTAEVVSMVVINDNAAADGLAMNKYGVTLHDFYGNPVGGALIKLEKDSVTADLFENPLGLISGVDGQVIFNLTDSIEERVEVTASFTNAGGAFTSESRYSVFSDPICSDVISGEILFVCPKKHNDASLRSVEAEDYCNDTGTRLPTINELLALFQENGHMGTAYGWNMGDYYWSSTMDGQGRTYDFNLTNGSVSNNNPADISKFACVSDGGEIDTARVASLTIEEDNARANTIERNVIEITLLDSEDRPVPGANINVQLGSNTVSTDEDIALLVSDGRGQVRLHLANTVGEPVAVEVSYTGYISGFTSLSTTSQFAAPLPFTYPLTEQEAIEQGVPYSSTQRENGSYGPDDVTFARMNWAEASSFCINQGKRLPSFDELELLYADEGNMWTALGWPTYWAYWTSTEHDTNPDYHWEVRLHDNSTSTQHNNNSRYVTCTN